MWNIQRMPQAREALQQADEPSETGDDISRLIAKTAELKSLLATLRPEFETSMPYLFGGAGSTASTLFTLPSPYDTACEYSVLTVSFVDAGSAILSSAGDPSGFLGNLVDVTGQGLYGMQMFNAVGEATLAPALKWLPIQASGQLSLAVNSSSKRCYVSVQFRRRINSAGVPNPGF